MPGPRGKSARDPEMFAGAFAFGPQSYDPDLCIRRGKRGLRRETFTVSRRFSSSQPERRFIGAPENGLAAAFARAKVAAKELL
jgi:hypothetical protein